MTAVPNSLSLTDAVEIFDVEMQRRITTEGYSDQTVKKATLLARQFVAFAQSECGTTQVDAVTPRVVQAFINAPVGRSGDEPTGGTKDTRRWAVLRLFKLLRGLGLTHLDPVDARNLSRHRVSYRPLTDTEIARCHEFTDTARGDGLLAAKWALAEATGRECEIPVVTVADFDSHAGRVWLQSGHKGVSRWGYLTRWGQDAIARRIDQLGSPNDATPLAHTGVSSSAAQQSAISRALRGVLNDSGLGTDVRVRPASVRAWAGRRVYQASRDIVEVAVRLGSRSLDDTWRTIGLDDPRRDDPPAHRVSMTSGRVLT